MIMAKYNNYSEVFNSLSAFNNALNNRPLNPVFDMRKNLLASHNYDYDFKGTHDYKEASYLMLHGDSTNLDKLVAVDGVDLSQLRGSKKVNRQQKAVCGGFPLVPVYLAGVPKNMLASKKITIKTKVITLAYNIGVDCNTTTREMVQAGAKVTSIIKHLEHNGIRCNLYVCSSTKIREQIISMAVKIKDAGAPLNLLNVAFPLINPSMYRRFSERFLELCPVPVYADFSYSYGCPLNFEKDSEIAKKINCAAALSCKQIIYSDIKDLANEIIKQITI